MQKEERKQRALEILKKKKKKGIQILLPLGRGPGI